MTQYVAIAAEVGCTPMQLAYAFCGSRSYVSSTIVTATSMAQLREDMCAFEVSLTPDVLEAVDDVHRLHRNPSLYD